MERPTATDAHQTVLMRRVLGRGIVDSRAGGPSQFAEVMQSRVEFSRRPRAGESDHGRCCALAYDA
jgi:hypothetical protein